MPQDAIPTPTPPDSQETRQQALRAVDAAAVTCPSLFPDARPWRQIRDEARLRLWASLYRSSQEEQFRREQQGRLLLNTEGRDKPDEPTRHDRSWRGYENAINQETAEERVMQFLKTFPTIKDKIKLLVAQHDAGTLPEDAP